MSDPSIARGDVTTLQLAVPAVDPLLRRLRRALGDDVTVLSPGHISFGYPWLPPAAAAGRIDAVTAALARVPPPTIELVGPRAFAPDERGRVLVHLVPDPSGPVVDLAAVVASAADTPVEDHTPHCSLVRVPARTDLRAVERVVGGTVPITTRLTTVELRVRRAGDWHVARRIRLGTASSSPGLATER